MNLKSLLLIIPIMMYYLIESFFIAIFINTAWKFILQPQFNITLTYIHWVFIIWIVKVLTFDAMKIAAIIASTKNNNVEVESNEL